MAVRLSRAERAAATEWRLLEAAYRVFLRLGFHGATLDAVAQEAGFTKGAVYSRFGSKADLFLALLARRAEQRARDVRAAAAEVEPDALAARAGRQWTEILHDDLGWMLLVIEFRVHAARVPELNRRYAPIHDLVLGAAAENLAHHAEALGIAPAVSAMEGARGLMALMSGLVLEQAAAPDALPDPAVLTEMMIRGLVTTPAASVARRTGKRRA
jgi:AcrR family transcriptional regulator